jgi:hypothetical protein
VESLLLSSDEVGAFRTVISHQQPLNDVMFLRLYTPLTAGMVLLYIKHPVPNSCFEFPVQYFSADSGSPLSHLIQRTVTKHKLHFVTYPETLKLKVKLSSNKSWRLRRGMECCASILTLTFGTNRTTKLSALGAGRTLPLRKFLGTHFS